MGRFDIALASVSAFSLGVVLAFAAIVLAAYAFGPRLLRYARATRPATGDFRRRLAGLRAEVGLEVEETWILAVKKDDRPAAFVRGPVGHRILFVSEYLVREYDDDTIRALLAAQAAEVDVWYPERRIAGLLGLGSVLLGLLTADIGLSGAAVGGLFAVFVVALHLVFPAYCRRLVYRADEHAAAQVGRDALADALSQVAANQSNPTGATRYLRFRPTLPARVAALRASGDDAA